MKFISITILLSLLLSHFQFEILYYCDIAISDESPVILFGFTKLADYSTVTVETMTHLNTCLTQITQYAYFNTQLTIGINGINLSSEIISINLNINTIGAFDTKFDLFILDESQSPAYLTTDKAYELFLNNIETNISQFSGKGFQFSLIANNRYDRVNGAQLETAKTIMENVGFIDFSTFDGVCQNISNNLSFNNCITIKNKNDCEINLQIIDLSSTHITLTELNTCLSQVNNLGNLLHTLNVDISEQNLIIFPDLAIQLSKIKSQIKSITLNISNNALTDFSNIQNFSTFSGLENATIDISNNGLSKNQVIELLQIIENTQFATDLELTIILLSNKTINQNQISDYDILTPSLTSQSNIKLTYGLLKNDGTTLCQADNGDTGFKNNSWRSSTKVACNDIEKYLEFSINNKNPLICKGNTVVITLNPNWINGDDSIDAYGNVVYSYKVYNQGTDVNTSTMQSLDYSTFINTLIVDQLTVGETYTVTATISPNLVYTTSFVPRKCVANGNIAVTDSDQDFVNEVCEQLIISVPVLNNDDNNLDQATLTWTWTIDPIPLIKPITNKSQLIIEANTLTADTEYTVTASIIDTVMVILNGDEFKFTPVACNNSSNNNDNGDNDNDNDEDDEEDDDDGNDNNGNNYSPILNYFSLLVAFVFIL